MALPNDKISIPMVARELGTTENDLGRLCTHENINPLSKFKPVRRDGDNPSNDPDWWKTGNGMYSLEVNSATNYKDATNLQWIYLKPNGGESSPYRLGDFRGYNHNAESDINSGYTTGISVALDDISNGITFGNTLPVSQNSIKASDLNMADLGSYYFSVILESETTSATIMKSAVDNIANGGNTVTFAKNEIDIALYEKQLTAYVVLSYNNLNDNSSGGNYYPACDFNGYINRVPVYISNVLSIVVNGDYYVMKFPDTLKPLSSNPTIEVFRSYAPVLTITNNFSNYPFPVRLSTFKFTYKDFTGAIIDEETATEWGTNADGGSTYTALGNNDVVYIPAGQTKSFAYKHDYFLRGGAPVADGTEIETGFKVTTLHNGQTKTVSNTLPVTYKLNINL